jgi:hypothetical protein
VRCTIAEKKIYIIFFKNLFSSAKTEEQTAVAEVKQETTTIINDTCAVPLKVVGEVKSEAAVVESDVKSDISLLKTDVAVVSQAPKTEVEKLKEDIVAEVQKVEKEAGQIKDAFVADVQKVEQVVER